MSTLVQIINKDDEGPTSLLCSLLKQSRQQNCEDEGLCVVQYMRLLKQSLLLHHHFTVINVTTPQLHKLPHHYASPKSCLRKSKKVLSSEACYISVVSCSPSLKKKKKQIMQ